MCFMQGEALCRVEPWQQGITLAKPPALSSVCSCNALLLPGLLPYTLQKAESSQLEEIEGDGFLPRFHLQRLSNYKNLVLLSNSGHLSAHLHYMV